ncbi:MAG: hypothetical protein EOO51_08345 [Flavobacterium sp.]|nr:MAG: hypothetical protein EOO51_08345 [Flavobacterium sp.]
MKVDTSGVLANGAGQTDNLMIFAIFCLVGLGLFLWLSFSSKSKSGNNFKGDDRTEPIGKAKKPFKPQKSQQPAKLEPILKPEILGKPATPKVVDPAPEEQVSQPSKPKYIGYTPINLFEQTEPLNFPYVIMPKPGCVIKFPQKGRSGRKGYKEEHFKAYLRKYFKESFELFDDRFILVKDRTNPYEPDFTLIDEKEGTNIFLDIEIDEPYEGINNIERRKPTHYRFSDINRNNAFKSRGWIVIRFAEIQVHQNPDGCCRFVADVIANIHSSFAVPEDLLTAKRIMPVPQWTKEEAEEMSRERYRERYLDITSFGVVADNLQIVANESEQGIEVEEIVIDETPVIIPAAAEETVDSTNSILQTAIRNKHFVSFIYNGTRTIVKPISFNNEALNCYCYIKNCERHFSVVNITNPIIKRRPFTLEATGPNLGLDRIVSVVNTAIQYHKFIRMRYTRAAWTSRTFDNETGEVIVDITEAEESTRTINNVQLALEILDEEQLRQYNLDENYITAYCNKREEQRTFRFDRISEIAILDL